MVVSKLFREALFLESFKGFKHDSKRNRVEPCLLLEIEGKRRLVSDFAKYGFETEEEAEEAIRKCLSNNSELSLIERKVEKLDFINLPSGTVVRLGREYGQLLSLLYLGNYKFFVYDDTEHCLQVGDMVQSVEKGVTVNRKACFWIYEKGEFPSDSRKVYSIGDVFSISWYMPINTPVVRGGGQIIVSPKIVYAWRPTLIDDKETVFEEKNITDDPTAPIVISFEDNTYRINPGFNASVFENANHRLRLFEDFLNLISDEVDYDNSRPIDMKCIREIKEVGHLTFVEDARCFVITKKMKIRI